MRGNSKKIILSLIVLLLISNVYWLADSYYHREFPFKAISSLKRLFITTVPMSAEREAEYVEKIVSEELAQTANFGNNTASIETSVLPLNKAYTSLVENSFPKGGGALAVVAGKILILDRLGSIYLFADDIVKQLDITVPNNLNGYITGYDKSPSLTANSFRAHSIFFDSKQSKIIASFTRFESGLTTRLVVASIIINPTDFTTENDWEIIYESPEVIDRAHQTQAGGGKILLKDNALFLSVGYNDSFEKDGKWYSKSQDPKSEFSKILKINLDNNQVEIYSTGIRNAQGMAIFNQNKIIATDHGPQGGDEINLIESGKNYGWPTKTHGTLYGTYDFNLPLEPIETSNDFTEPMFAFVPSIGIANIIQVDKFNERWQGDLLVGSLKAQSIYRLKQAEGRIIYQEPIWIGNRIRDMVELDNKLIILTDQASLITITVDSEKLATNSKGDNLIAQKSGIKKCITCHQFTPSNKTSLAPSLLKIYNKQIGSDNYDNYSDALANFEGVWNEENLRIYIQDPAKLITGSTMPAMKLTDKELDDVISLLKMQ
ncbi:MAG: PQQ-dependent sugar dehydrogenase [Flavobacteriales bacterium]|nr:PQQ-dependent sugar dehydrogenase [Flavobacteriales bacterium]